VRVWDVESGRELRVLPENGKGVAALDFGPAGLLAVSSWDRSSARGVWGIVNVWDAESGERLEHLEHGVKPIAALAFSPDGANLAAGTWDNDVAIWRLGEWGQPARIVPPKTADYQAVRDLAFAPDGKELVVSYADGRARRYDTDTRALLGTLDTTSLGNVKELNDVVYLPDGERLATVGADLALRLWERESGVLLSELAGHLASVQSVVASAEGRWIYTGAADGSVRAWDLEQLAPERSTWRGPSTSYSLALDPSGARAALTGWEGFIRVVEVESGRELARWKGHEQSGVGIDWSADGRFLASTGNDGKVKLWDAASRALVRELAALSGQILCARFSPDGKLLAAPGEGSTLALWDVPDGDAQATLAGDGGRVGYLAFSPDGKRLAAAHPDGRVRLWDVESRKLVAVLEGHRPGQVALAFHPRSSELLTASGRELRRWHARTGAAVGAPFEAASGVHYLAYSPDGERVAAGLSNADLELWTSAARTPLLRKSYRSGVWFTTWTRDGTGLFALPMDETVRVLWAR
jgi:WD40 repeat protein